MNKAIVKNCFDGKILPEKGSAGFTLLELLVTLVVLGFLAVGLTEGVRLGVKSWDRQSAAVAEHADLDTVDRTLRSLISGLEPNAKGTKGGPDQFSFTATLPNTIEAVKSHRADMQLVNEDNRLMLHWQEHRHQEDSNQPETHAIELIGGIARVQFAYRADKASDSGLGTDWQAEWHDVGPPRLIRIHLVFPEGDRRYWPDIVIAVIRSQPLQ